MFKENAISNNANGTVYYFGLDDDGNISFCMNQDEPWQYLSSNRKKSISDMIRDGEIKFINGKIIAPSLSKIDRVYLEKHWEDYVSMKNASTGVQDEKSQISLDALGIILENVEMVCADPVKIIARNSSNITGENLDIVLNE